MQKEKIIELLGKLKRNKIESQEEVKKILNCDERVLESLLDFDNDNDIKKALYVVINLSKEEEKLVALSILKFARKNGSGVFDEAYDVLTNEKTIQNGIALEGAKLILEAKADFQAEYASRVLTNNDAIQGKITLDYLLRNSDAIQKEIPFEVARDILTENSKNKELSESSVKVRSLIK